MIITQNKSYRIVGIIPARYASTRFPGKPLIDLGGKTMIERVYTQASKALDDVYVATDDERILQTVLKFGGKAIMTSDNHASGTDRCYEAISKIDTQFDIIVNIQGDEPFIQPSQILQLIQCFDDDNTQIATLAKPISEKDGIEYLENPNHPKVIINSNRKALYFSRSVIPYIRGIEKEKWISTHEFYKHIGLYAYKSDILKAITQLSQSPLELSESLEQLRWLEHGYYIKVGISDFETIGIDTPEDIDKIKHLLE
jgi:3-deoxy-manno-octulosonate cytidylyltransferase (CMP-KDO synthetase)